MYIYIYIYIANTNNKNNDIAPGPLHLLPELAADRNNNSLLCLVLLLSYIL